MTKPNPWTEAEDKVLRDGVASDTSYGIIAKRLPGRTRMAVIGRAWRLGLSTPDAPVLR